MAHQHDVHGLLCFAIGTAEGMVGKRGSSSTSPEARGLSGYLVVEVQHDSNVSNGAGSSSAGVTRRHAAEEVEHMLGSKGKRGI